MSTPERPPLENPLTPPPAELAPLPEQPADAPTPPAALPDSAHPPIVADEIPDPAARRERTPASPSSSSSSSGTRRAGQRKPRKAKQQPQDAPPTRARARTEVKLTSTVLAKGLEQTIQGVAIAVTILDQEDGAIIARGEPRLTAALVATAEQNPRFKKRLEELLQGGTYMQLAVAVGAIVLPITMRHAGGMLPPQLRAAAAMVQHEPAPDTVPAAWTPEPAFVHEPGRIYSDEQGAYTLDELGNVIPIDPDA